MALDHRILTLDSAGWDHHGWVMLFWIEPCQLIVPLVPVLQKVWRKGLWSRQTQVFCIRLHQTVLIFLCYTNCIQPVVGCFHGCSLPQQDWLKRSRKHAQERNKGSDLQPMPPSLRGGPGRHPGPGEYRLPSPFSGVHSGGQEPVLHHSNTVVLWTRTGNPELIPSAEGSQPG